MLALKGKDRGGCKVTNPPTRKPVGGAGRRGGGGGEGAIKHPIYRPRGGGREGGCAGGGEEDETGIQT